jgi:uncharacterized spore protein YtfJ
MQIAESVKQEVAESKLTESGSFIERFAKTLGATTRASTIFGEPVVKDGITVIPVATARWAFGGGGGQRGEERGSGGGGGVILRPVGFIEISSDRAEFRRISSVPVAPVAVLSASVGLLLFRWLLKR